MFILTSVLAKIARVGIEKVFESYVSTTHRWAGRNPFLNKSLLGGDPPNGYPHRGLWVEDVAFDDNVVVDEASKTSTENDATNIEYENDEGGKQPPALDDYHDVQRQVMEVLDRDDTLHAETEVVEEWVD